jgi:hypothetical protein
MTKTQELRAKADHFAERAASAKQRTARNTFLSLEQTVRTLAANEERAAGERQREGA